MKESPNPPKLLLRFFRWFCHPDLSKYVEGDLREIFDANVQRMGLRSAQFLFFIDVLKLFRPGIIKSKEGSIGAGQLGNIRQSIKLSLRGFQRNKAFAFLNLAGLAIGISSCTLIMLWVEYETSFDAFHEKSDRLYRISCNSDEFYTALSPPALAGALPTTFSDVEASVRLKAYNSGSYNVGNNVFKEEKVLYADSNFLDLFSYRILHGSPHTVLDGPNKVAISSSTALKFFGTENAVGRVLEKDGADELIVSGVFDDVPSNSHLDFDIIHPMSYGQSKARFHYDSNWSEFAFRTYMLSQMEYGYSQEDLNTMKHDLKKLYLSHEPGFEVHFNIEPIESIHLYNDLQFDTDVGGNILYVRTLTSVAIFLLLIACINYMNLSTAQSVQRSKEAGLRRVIGASRIQVMIHFFVESFIHVTLSTFLSIAIVYLVLPYFNSILDLHLIFELIKPRVLLSFLTIIIVLGLLAGSYPAILLSKPSSGQNFHKAFTPPGSSFNLRNALVVIQFVISIFLIAANFIVTDQMELLQNKNLGFDKSNLVYSRLSGPLYHDQKALRDILDANPQTSNHTFISDIPVDMGQANHGLDWEGKDPNFQGVIANMGVDENFFEVFQIELIAGRSFTDRENLEEKQYLINQSAVRIMGFETETAVGKWLDLHGKGKIVGVFEDFHFKSLHLAIEPLILVYYPNANYVVFRSEPTSLDQTIQSVESAFREIDSDHQFEFGFIDQELNGLYKSEKQMSVIFRLFALLSILISCLGLFGLTIFMVANMGKQIGIRKVLGATRLGLASLLSKDFIRLLAISLLLSGPITYSILTGWLEKFAYRIAISPAHFVSALACSLVLVVATISYQLYKASSQNPVDLLRDE